MNISTPSSPRSRSVSPFPGAHRPRSTVAKIFAQPSVRAFLYFLVLFVLFVLYGHTHFYRDPGSIFFDQKSAYTRWYSDDREDEAKKFIEAAVFAASGRDGFDGGDYQKANKDPMFCVTFPTVLRDVARPYIDTSIGSVLEGLLPAERAEMNLQIFFATTHPLQHPTFGQPWLRNLVDSVFTYEEVVSEQEFARLARLEAEHLLAEKSVADYSLALERCYQNTSSPYIAIFEDDIIMADSWLARSFLSLNNTVHKVVEVINKDPAAPMEVMEGNDKTNGEAIPITTTVRRNEDWLYLRLFNQERSTRFANAHIGGNNEFWIILFGALGLYTFIKLCRSRSRLIRSQIDDWTLGVICLIALPAFVVLFFQSGKASVLPPRDGVRQEGFGCCSQGLIFNRLLVPELVAFLREKNVGQYDLLTMEFARMHGYPIYTQYPVMMQHIGSHSARETTDEEAQAVWSMAFENLSPKKLKKQHQRLIDKIYPETHGKIEEEGAQKETWLPTHEPGVVQPKVVTKPYYPKRPPRSWKDVLTRPQPHEDVERED